MKIPLRYISIASRAQYLRDFAFAAASLAPDKSAINRIGNMLGHASTGLTTAAGLAMNSRRKACHRYHDESMYSAILKYGTKVAAVQDGWAYRDIEVYALGDVLVYFSPTIDEYMFESEAKLEDIGRALFAAATVELGVNQRLSLVREGFAIDTEVAPPRMAQATRELAERLAVELKHRHRSVLLYGPAGAGKTSAARQLVEILSGTTLVVSSDSLTEHTFDLLAAIRPDAVIFDDFDRGVAALGEDMLLGGLTRLRVAVPLVIATANVAKVFSGSLQRPKRFDRVVEFDALDDDIASNMVPSLTGDQRALAIASKLLPSYLDELDFRVSTGDDFDDAFADMLARQAGAGDGMHSDASPANKVRSVLAETSRDLRKLVKA